MTKRFLMILVMVSWCSVGFAETRLNCKYYDSLRTVHAETTTTIGEIKNAQKFITIILDMENKKIIQTYSPDLSDYSGSKLIWEEGKIVWYKHKKLGNEKLLKVWGNLDRYTGRYHYEKKIFKDVLTPLEEIIISYKCEVKKTKF